MDLANVTNGFQEKTTICNINQVSKKYYRDMQHRIFVNRSLHLENIKFFGFDMDYTLAEYSSPDLESDTFRLAVERLLKMGYPAPIGEFEYDPQFPIRGLWYDTIYGNLLKVDPYGNILVCVHGFKFLKTSEIYAIYPNKFVQPDESRIVIFSTLFNQPEIYLNACVIDYFSNSPDYISTETGVRQKGGNIYMPYRSIFQDVRNAFEYLHAKGDIKELIVNNLAKYLRQDDRLPMLFKRMNENDKKTFLLTNSDYSYTNKIMSYLFDVPSANNRSWKSYFDYIVVDSSKPLFFGEGTILRQVDTTTGSLRIGTFVGTFQKGAVYSGGSCDVFTQLIGAKGKDVLYVGDHIYGDILKSKKTRGWRTFLVVPELLGELRVWTTERNLFEKLQMLDCELSELYKDLDSSCRDKPDLTELRINIRNTIHQLDMNYGILGSIFRCGSRQTHFANQISRYADLYACTFLNLYYYPFSYMFRAPPMLMPHESTVNQDQGEHLKDSPNKNNDEKNPFETDRKPSVSENSRLPHLYAETPTVVTHHHDTDDEDSESSNE